MRKIRGRRGRRAATMAAAVLTLAFIVTPHAMAAEPDHTATLDRDHPRFTWEGSGSGMWDPSVALLPDPLFRCTDAPFTCDYILLRVRTTGVLTLTLDFTDGDPVDELCDPPVCASEDLDGYVYRSNAAGEPIGYSLSGIECASGGSRETCKVPAWPGFFLVEIEYFLALDTQYTGTVELRTRCGRPCPLPGRS